MSRDVFIPEKLGGLFLQAPASAKDTPGKTQVQLERMQHALRLFLSGDLGDIARVPRKLSNRKLTILSKTVKESKLPARSVKVLHTVGVRYVGELYRHRFSKRSGHYHDVCAFLAQHDLPSVEIGLRVDDEFILRSGWCPPYWDDPQVIDRLRVRVIDWENDIIRRGYHTGLGTPLNSLLPWSVTSPCLSDGLVQT